mgnify:FL=1
MELVYEGKAKRMFRRSDGLYLMVFKDEVTAGDGARRDPAPGKGALAAELSALLLRYLEDKGVRTHLVAYEPPNALVVKPAQVIPLEVIVRFKTYGSQLKRMPALKPLQQLRRPLVELHYKDDKLHDPLVLEEDVVEAGLVEEGELAYVKARALEAAQALRELYAKAGCDFLDVKFEFGRTPQGILLVDEISGDTFRLICGGEHLDKEYYRRTGDAAGLVERYREMLEKTRRLVQLPSP